MSRPEPRGRKVFQRLVAVSTGALGCLVALWAVTPEEWTNQIVKAGTLEASTLERVKVGVSVLLGLTSLAVLNYFFEARDNERNEAMLSEVKDYLAIRTGDHELVSEVRGRLSKLPPGGQRLTKYVGNYIVDRIETMLTEQFFEIQNGQVFQCFYRETFEGLRAPCDLLATALPAKSYLWRARDINALFADFIGRGGTLTRVFLVKDAAELALVDTQEVMRGQAEAGVRVGWVFVQSLDKPRLMMADRQRSISWELWTHSGTGEIDTLNASWNARTCDDRWRYLESVVRNATWYTSG